MVDFDAIPCGDRWSPIHLDPCDPPPINGALVIDADATYDTDSNELALDSGTLEPDTIVLQDLEPNVRVLFVADLDITDGATLSITGSMPLLLASNDSVDVAGALSVAADLDTGAAGSDPANCALGPPEPGENDSGGAGGGGGGGFQGTGGDGGDGNDDNGGSNGGGGGAAVGLTPATPRGGCSGADGGEGSNATFGLGGAGGGAIQVSARNRIAVTGTGAINAGGGGGGGAQGSDCGGGGGGSGGYVRLDAPDVDVLETAAVAANGGGGGGGSTNGAGANGSPGGDGGANATPAPGGSSSGASATDGANGGAGTSVNGASQNNDATGGAGGGGGAAGFVIVPASVLELGTSAFISPDPSEPL